MSTHKLITQSASRTAARLARETSRLEAAIAYVSNDTTIRFGHKDLLVVHASDAAISSGQTSAEVLRKALRRRARLLSNSELHAKIYAVDKAVLIGAANMSQNSQGFKEAAILSTELATISSSRAWIRALSGLT